MLVAGLRYGLAALFSVSVEYFQHLLSRRRKCGLKGWLPRRPEVERILVDCLNRPARELSDMSGEPIEPNRSLSFICSAPLMNEFLSLRLIEKALKPVEKFEIFFLRRHTDTVLGSLIAAAAM